MSAIKNDVVNTHIAYEQALFGMRAPNA